MLCVFILTKSWTKTCIFPTNETCYFIASYLDDDTLEVCGTFGNCAQDYL